MTTTTPSAAPASVKPKKNRLAAGHLSGLQVAMVGLGALIISTLIFGALWMSSGDELYTVTKKTGKLTMNFNWGAWLVVAGILYLVGIWIVSSAVEGVRQAKNRLVTGFLTVAFLMAMIPLASLIFTLVVEGLPGISKASFFLNDSRRDPNAFGGAHAIVGTLWITGITTLMAVPIGIFTAIYLVEYGKGNRLSRALNFFVDVMTGIPSIVAGLFAFTLFMLITKSTGGDLTQIKNGFVGAIALLVLMIPTVVRSAEEMIRLVPNELREASYALGVPKWRTIAKVVIPTCLGGLVTGVLLAIARVIGETAPLLVAAGYFGGMNTNPMSGSMASLPVFVYQQWKFHDVDATQLSWAGALVLLFIVMALNIIGRVVRHYFSPKGNR
ncbi:phosphate ABC transporter permease PstA [Gulosibacter bifidus]|uniref:Phosphate transport system permease protein PstA n=1 Tax=Gulosibacter bifidus TaxID=272239 RepID=A0ABW5RH62_9MICO|nr:phosphate ABC transporter permease PstA [Gulosibacter bifidus]